jgi:hypothetical protein
MILDSLLQFDPAGTSLANATGTYNSTNVLDLGVTSGVPTSANGGGARDIGIGDDNMLQLLVIVTTTFTSGGAGTLAINFQGAPDNGSGAPGTWTTYATYPTYALATLVAQASLVNQAVPRPPAGIVIPRFLRLTYVIGTAAFTAGAIESFILGQRIDQIEQTNAALGGYQAGITVAN